MPPQIVDKPLWHNDSPSQTSVTEVKHRPIEIVLGWGTDWVDPILCVIGRVGHVLSMTIKGLSTSVVCSMFVCVVNVSPVQAVDLNVFVSVWNVIVPGH